MLEPLLIPPPPLLLLRFRLCVRQQQPVFPGSRHRLNGRCRIFLLCFLRFL
ncbi:hypothetical protein HanRHA438_Chr05g0211331 [Helianthus annuus]|nr:hypothetical protein HanIR_Chr05g0217371 [Helianthus annuus]KAJ0917897.1 hypothetical protein HanRHA438_Chr05g0211331 [Helianthus annuus]